MAPNLSPKSPRMIHTHITPHHHHDKNGNHPIVPVTQPQQEISIDYQPPSHPQSQPRSTKSTGGGEGDGGVVGIQYHPLGKGAQKERKDRGRVRVNDGIGERPGKGYQTEESGSAVERVGVQSHGAGQETGHGRGYELSRQPHRHTQETGPASLPGVITANHIHPPIQHQHQHQHKGQGQGEGQIQTGHGPRLYIQPPTPEHITPPFPPLQTRSLNTSPTVGNHHIQQVSQEPERRPDEGAIKGKGEGQQGGIMNRFKTTFLSKNKGPMSKTWARKSYLNELESMAPSSPTSPRMHSAPVSPGHGDLESGDSGGMRRITDLNPPRARSVYASPIALAQFRALPPMNAQGEVMVPPR